MTATAEHPKNSVLDAVAVLMMLDRGDLANADLMLKSYVTCGESMELLNAIVAVALCATRYSAVTAGTTPERLLAGIAQEIRANA